MGLRLEPLGISRFPTFVSIVAIVFFANYKKIEPHIFRFKQTEILAHQQGVWIKQKIDIHTLEFYL
jgi:hypothetical protein